MEKEKVYSKLETYLPSFTQGGRGIPLTMKWDRGNGKLEEVIRFRGFDEKGPMLYFVNTGVRVDINGIGGYKAIISINHA